VTVFWTNRAADQLLDLRDSIARTSEVYADRVTDRLIERSEQLEAFPRSGRQVPEFDRDDVRELVDPPYRLIYRIRAERLDVLSVVHERQRLPPTPGAL
jgi:plasmid stabilization system protein ParE